MEDRKVAEVEMKELTPGDQDNKDEEKGKMDGLKEGETKKEKEESSKLKHQQENVYNLLPSTSSPKPNDAEKVEEKERAQKEEATAEEANVYSKLEKPSENVYMSVTGATPKHSEDIYRRVRLYKMISAVFIVLSLLLLAVVLALAMKFQSSQMCSDLIDVTSNQECQCFECKDGWEKFENSCYFISKQRLPWQKSREACQKKGGDLVVINNERVQKFLTDDGNMFYWIGLHYSEDQKWMWINNTAPTRSFWSRGQPNPDSQGSCALLNGGKPQIHNWLSNPCEVLSFFICQKQ
ncbi:CD209 antigen-like protein 2 isoform X1 [Tachysurus fulvidraco]|uniref:CD209 antigen-like protein 2 isoform X1 n=1 Tax=Tachysurus fulvidraco TaxID=1234273 RepID=UPI001FEDD250|nr:CD209 antigen-like protein 2 isoform X1 [Tachysurus fulvidraco]